MTSSNDDQDLVSVIVPAWNSERWLLGTLRSAAHQTHGNLEIIIVDDGSTDNTPELAEKFCKVEPRARLIRKSNGGPASARNAGIEEAKGAWIATLDSDDLWHPEKIERQLGTFADASPQVGLVYCWYRLIDEQDRVMGIPWRPVFEGAVFDQHLECNFVGTGSTPLIRRTALEGLRYDTEIVPGCEDWLLQLEIARRHELACTRAFLVGYRFGGDSVSSNRRRMTLSQEQMYRIIFAGDPQRGERLIRRQHARRRATEGLIGLRRGGTASSLVELVRAFAAAPQAAAHELATHLNHRLRRAVADHGPGESFLRASPDRGMSAMSAGGPL